MHDKIEAAPQRASHNTPESPGHRHHQLYQQCSAGVDALDRQIGHAPDERSACMKASLTALAATYDFKSVDRVLLSEQGQHVQAGQNVFIVQGDPKDPAHLRAHMPTDQAVGTSVELSFRALAQREQQHQPQPAIDLAVPQQQEEAGRGARTTGG